MLWRENSRQLPEQKMEGHAIAPKVREWRQETEDSQVHVQLPEHIDEVI